MKIDGKELKITPSSFKEAMDLQKSIARSLKQIPLKLSAGILTAEDVGSEDIGSLIQMVLSVGISEEVETNLFVCCERILLGEDKIDRDFFEPIENRKHYYPIMIEVIKVNVSPFFKSLASKFSGLGEKITELQTSKLQKEKK